MRAVIILATPLLLAIGCAPEATELSSAAILGEELLGPHSLDAEPLHVGVRAVQPTYAGARFDFRLELGNVGVDNPEVGLFVDRVLLRIDDDWTGLPPQGWDEPLDVVYSERQRWQAVWQGSLDPGTLGDVVIDLGEDAHVTVDDLAYDAVLVEDSRQLEAECAVQTAHPAPIVMSILLDAKASDGEVDLELVHVMLREVDANGWPHPYAPAE